LNVNERHHLSQNLNNIMSSRDNPQLSSFNFASYVHGYLQTIQYKK